jgi:hypothetical protein
MRPARRLSHAQGYLGLEMLAEAAAELDQIPPAEQDTLPVLAVRLALLQAQASWPSLRAVAARCVELCPAEAGFWITWAYATRRADSLAAAQAILHSAERRHATEPTIQFNLGCYAAQLGALEAAHTRVLRAIALDRSFAALAATDPDLAPLRAAGHAFG